MAVENSKLTPETPNADVKIVVVHTPSVVMWLMNLFDPPPLVTMTFRQKVGRVVLLSTTLVIGSIVVAMLGAVGLYLIEKAHELDSTPEFLQGLAVIVVGVGVNGLCLAILLQVKRADHKLLPPKS